MSEKLNPCPFCGKKPKLIDIFSKDLQAKVYTVRCEHCKTMLRFFTTSEEAINSWNSANDEDTTVVKFKACPVCNHAPAVLPFKLDDDKTAYIVGCPRCHSQAFITDSLEKAQLLWNKYSEETKAKS